MNLGNSGALGGIGQEAVNRFHLWSLTLGLWLLAWCLAAPAVATPTLEQEQEIRTTLVTPHTKWAQPYAGGMTRVLFFSDYRETRAREIVELMQRFDIKADAAYWTRSDKKPHPYQWHNGEEGIARIRRLLESNVHEVFLFNGVSPDNLPRELRDALLARVAQGRGLVLVGVKERQRLDPPLDNDPDRVALDEPLMLDQPFPRQAGRGEPDAELFALKQGRAARLPPAPVVDYVFGWEVAYDYWQERLGRTVLWAAGKLSAQPLNLRREPGADTANPAEVRLVVTLSADAPIAQVRIRERRDDGLVVRDSTQNSPPWPRRGGAERRGGSDPAPAAEWELAGPAAAGLPAGRYYDEVIASDAAGRVVAWATLPFVVASHHQARLELSRTWGEIGETLAGKVSLAGPALENGRVLVELRDRRGRILAATPPVASNQAMAPFSFPIPEWYPMLVQVRAVVRDDAGEVVDAVAYFNVTKRHRDRFNFLSWAIPIGPTAAWAHEALARLGVTLELGNSTPVMAAYDMAVVPYTTRILAEKDERGWMKPVPWNQEPEIQQYVENLVAKYEPARRHGVFAYSLGDETVTRGSDVSPSDLVAYRRYLQGIYGNIAALNESWGTAYAEFEAIELLEASDPTEAGAKLVGHYARWHDRQAWESANFLGLCRRFGEEFRRLDPQALTGFEGAGRVGSSDDIEGIVRTNGFWTPYPGPGDQVLRGIAPRDFPYANWMGYARDVDSLTWSYWRMVLNGSHGVWWYRWDGIGRFIGLLRPDLSPSDEVAAMLEDTRITREGLGDLLLRSEMQTDGIALFYSQPSMIAAQVAEGPSYGRAASQHEAWQQVLLNLGLSFNYMTDAMLRRGDIDPRTTRVLILPRAEALGEEEARRITTFVEAGGTVIADVRPGRFTGRGKPRTAGALDALFGVDSRGSAGAVQRATMEIRLGEGQPTWRFEGMTVDSGVVANGAIVLGRVGQAPVVFSHAVGRGRAILLNFLMTSYPRMGAVGSPAGTAELWRALLDQAGVAAPFTLVRADGSATGNLQTQRWRTGEIELLGLMRDPETPPRQYALTMKERDAPADFVLKLASPRWIYDLRDHRDLGRQSEIRLKLNVGRATFLALLPEAAPALQAMLSSEVVQPGETPELQVKAPQAVGAHAVWMTVVKPDGIEADELRATRVIQRGEIVRLPLPVALNEARGRWLVRLRELYTGRLTELPLSVREVNANNGR